MTLSTNPPYEASHGTISAAPAATSMPPMTAAGSWRKRGDLGRDHLPPAVQPGPGIDVARYPRPAVSELPVGIGVHLHCGTERPQRDIAHGARPEAPWLLPQHRQEIGLPL